MTSLDIRPGQLWRSRQSLRLVLVITPEFSNEKDDTLWRCMHVTDPSRPGMPVHDVVTYWFANAQHWTRVA